MYVYLISRGEYSSYSVSSLAVSKEQIPQQTLSEWQREAETNKVRDIEKFLTDKGLNIVYAAGEFWQGNYFEGLSFGDNVKDSGEPDSFRLHLA